MLAAVAGPVGATDVPSDSVTNAIGFTAGAVSSTAGTDPSIGPYLEIDYAPIFVVTGPGFAGVASVDQTTNPNGTTTVTSSGGSYFNGRRFSAFSETYRANGTLLETDHQLNVGFDAVTVAAGGQTIRSTAPSIISNRDAPENTFVFEPGHALGVIHNFIAAGNAHDTVSLPGRDFGNSLATVLHNTVDYKGGAVIFDPVTHDVVRLMGVTTADLQANPKDIKFHS